jgi:hypothetical protein
MSTISTQLRNFKEPTRDQLTHIFFSIPEAPHVPVKDKEKQRSGEVEKMEINAILSLGAQGVEDSYVSDTFKHECNVSTVIWQAGKLHLLPPYLTFSSLDRKSVRFTLPLSTIRRVERLNARAGVYALSLSTWHGMKIVSDCCYHPSAFVNICVDRAVDLPSTHRRSILQSLARSTQS